MKKSWLKIVQSLLMLLVVNQVNFGQTTGKISGKIVDKETKEPLIGANILIEGTSMGGAANIDGEYFIINVPPGKYNLRISMMSYQALTISDVVVSVNRTADVDVELSIGDLKLDEVVVSIAAVAQRKDQTSSIKNVSAEQIVALPVENMEDVVDMQAGVVDGHFRGGRKTEVSYMVDGMPVTEGFRREANGITVEPESVQDLEVITGTFNAEYGRAMSGIVNMVTKDGSNDKFHGSAVAYNSAYLTANEDIFIGLTDGEVNRNQDYRIQFEGPIVKDYITMFTNFRYVNEMGHLNGIRRFNVNDYSNFSNANINGELITPWDAIVNDKKYYSEYTGDNEYVPLGKNEYSSLLAKLAFNLSNNFKFSLMYTRNNSEIQNYNHYYKYRPDGRATNYSNSDFFIFQANHVLSRSMFHDLKVSLNKNNYETYLYADQFDSRYVADNYNSSAGGFASGGQDKGYTQVLLNDFNIKYDLVWQVDVHHSIKTGLVYTNHDLTNEIVTVRDEKWGSGQYDDFHYDENIGKIVFNPYEPELLDSAITSDNYNMKPYELSAYLQDKMEYDDLVINFGLRYDYFNSNTLYPTQLRNPANQLSYPNNPERMSDYEEAQAQSQFSPRFGLSYTLGSAAVLHFSYGHFFQMPPLYALYENSRFLVPSGNYQTVHGNPNLKSEKTVQYELGLWLEIVEQMGIELSVFYRDIYDLQTAIIITTYNQIKYGLYSNKDYGNSKGMELKYDFNTGPLSLNVNYTLLYTRGIADNPTSTFTRAGRSMDEISKLIPLEWDQRHTLNFSIGYLTNSFGANLTAYYNSGLAYSYVPIPESPLFKQTLYPNNQYRPSQFNIDLKSHYDLHLSENVNLRFFLIVYNLIDKLNEVAVDPTTGRAYTSIVRPTEISTFKSNFNDVYDSSQDPSMYAPPREIKIGIGLVF